MRIIMEVELGKNEMPLDYRRACVSFIKSSLSKGLSDLYESLYKEDVTKQKNFTFNLKLGNPKFSVDKIILDVNEIKLMVSTNDFNLGISMYNCFLMKKGKTYMLANDNFMKINNIMIENHKKIISNEVRIKFYAPIIVRNHVKGESDKYYLFNDVEFGDYLNNCVENQLHNCGINNLSNSKIELKPVDARKVVVKSFGINIPGSLGIFDLKGDNDVINSLYQMGIGSRRSQGFGTFEILS